jgi:tetratricopeptide (TPR) repeat protein
MWCVLRLLRRTLCLGVAIAVASGAAVSASDEKAAQAFQQAQKSLAHGDFDTAIARLDEAVRLEPKDAKCRGLRGMAWLRKGDYVRGAADLKAAIELNPGDAGRGYQPSSTKQLSAEALAQGRRQATRMLHDRPAMDQFGDEAKFLRDWAARKFAGEDFGDLIDWDPASPLHSDAEHLAPGDHGERAAILVEANYSGGPQAGKPRSFEELWAGAIYELHNVDYAREFKQLNKDADRGRVSKRAFVAGILKYELMAAQRTRAFYVQVFLPWAEKKRLPTDPRLWFCDWWDTAENMLKNFTDKSAYPWRPYARQHDWATVHRQWRLGKFSLAQRILQRMRKEEGYEEDRSDVSYWIGRCLARRNKPDEALAAYDEAIRLDPGNADAYRARAELHEKLGNKEKAKADFNRAKLLEDAEQR